MYVAGTYLSFIDIYYDVLLEAYGIVGYHGACIFHVDGLHIETYRLIVILYIIGECYLIDAWLIYLLGASIGA